MTPPLVCRFFITFCALLMPLASSSLLQQPPGTPVFASDFLMEVQGNVRLQRGTWKRPTKVTSGTSVQPGDIITRDVSAKAVIVCADLQQYVLNTDTITQDPCSRQPAYVRFKSELIEKPRGPRAHELFPVVLAPRKTELLRSAFLLRWAPVQRASYYWVSIQGQDVNWSTVVANKTSYYFSADQEAAHAGQHPYLLAGVKYHITVRAYSSYQTLLSSSDEDQTPDRDFTIMTEQEARAVSDIAGHISRLNLSDDSKKFLTAVYYHDQRLLSDALDTLATIREGNLTVAMLRERGDLQSSSGLPALALESYEMAEQEAHSQHASYAQEIAEERIADLPIVSEDLRKAKLKAAQAIRESLADTKPNR